MYSHKTKNKFWLYLLIHLATVSHACFSREFHQPAVGREQEIATSLCRLVQTGRRLMQPHSHTCWECLRKRPVAPRSHVIVSCAVARKTAVANGVKRRPVYFHASSHVFCCKSDLSLWLEPYLPTSGPFSFMQKRTGLAPSARAYPLAWQKR